MPKGHPKRLQQLPSEFTPRQKSILLGSLLGDGCLSKTIISPLTGEESNCHYEIKQRADRREYLEWLFAELSPFATKLTNKTDNKPNLDRHPTTGKIVNDGSNGLVYSCRLRTCRSSLFKTLRHHFYPEGIKRVPITLQLDPLMLTVWFVEDGCNQVKHRTARICTDGFTHEEVDFLSLLLNNTFNLKSYQEKKRKRIRIPSACYSAFIDLLKPHCYWRCFDYKFAHRVSRRYGSLHHRVVITQRDALDCQSAYDTGTSIAELAKQYGVCFTTIWRIIKGKHWSCVHGKKIRS